MICIETGTWTDYNDWSACSVTCGEGYQFRKRQCLSSDDKARKIPTDNCIGKDIEIQPCDITTCPGKTYFSGQIFKLSVFFTISVQFMVHGHHGHHVQHFVVLV